MKLRFILLLSVLLIFTITACKSKKADVTAQPVEAENEMPAPNDNHNPAPNAMNNFDLPEIPPAKLFQHVTPEMFKLNNGMDVWYVYNPMVPLMSFKVVFEQGASADPADKSGRTAFTAAMLKEIREGVGETGIHPGVIGEIGTSEILYPMEQRALLAAANVSLETGFPVYVHTYPWSRAGIEAIDLLLNQGVKPRSICICHLDVCFNEGTIFRALDRGVYVEFDNLSKEFYFPSDDGAFAGGPFETDVARARMLKRLVDLGYGDRLLLANDLCLKASLHRYGGDGYDYVFNHFAMMMRMEGIDDNNISKLLDENPRRFLFGE